MQKVFVLDTNKKPLMPTHPAKARKLLKAGKAALFRRYPFTIILKYAITEPKTQEIELKVDPGSKTTGLSLSAKYNRGWVVVWAANLTHRGGTVKLNLDKRRAMRRSRRSRKTRIGSLALKTVPDQKAGCCQVYNQGWIMSTIGVES